MDRIMQLPDCCFGRRWPVSVGVLDATPGTYYDISEAGLPERCVVWSAFYVPNTTSAAHTRVSLALGDHQPVNDAQFDALDALFRDLGFWVGTRRVMAAHAYTGAYVISFRQQVQISGRRLVGRFEMAAGSVYPTVAGVVVSSIPTEVPDWLCSGNLRSL